VYCCIVFYVQVTRSNKKKRIRRTQIRVKVTVVLKAKEQTDFESTSQLYNEAELYNRQRGDRLRDSPCSVVGGPA